MKAVETFCPSCREIKDVEVLLQYETKLESYVLSEGPIEEHIPSLIVKCNTCQQPMMFFGATPETIAGATPAWPQELQWLTGQLWSDEFDQLDSKALLAATDTEKATAISQLFNMMFSDYDCERDNFVSSFEALIERQHLDASFMRASKILSYLEVILHEGASEVRYNDMLHIQKLYLAVRSQLYETPSLIKDFDEQWSDVSERYFGGGSS